MIIAVTLIVIAGSACIGVFIFPLFAELPDFVKVVLLYLVCGIILTIAELFCPDTIQAYVALLGAGGLGGTWNYHYDLILKKRYDLLANDTGYYQAKQINMWLLTAPLVLVWGALAIYFKSKMIGFITVGAFEGLIGFSMWFGRLCYAFGFNSQETARRALIVSGLLLVVHVSGILELQTIAAQASVFEIGILFLGTFVYFLALLVLSSSWHDRYGGKNLVLYNVLAIVSGLLAFYLGAFSPNLRILRAVGGTFFVFYLLEKWSEIEWGKAWSIGLLGAGCFLAGLGIMAKTHLEWFLP